MPKVSIVILLYNLERYIGECVQSALDQTYTDLEVIVVDDGSTDSSSEVLKRFGGRITGISQKNGGPANALNAGIRASKGEYIAWMGADDIFMPEKTEEQVAFMEANPDVDVSYTDYYMIDAEGEIIREIHSPYYEDKKDFLWNMVKGNFINGATVMFKRKCVEAVGYFDEEMRYHADGNMWFRMLKHFKFGHVPETLVRYRWHKLNLSHHKRRMKSYLRLHYKKIFYIYRPEELVPGALSPADARFRLARTLLGDQGLYSLALKKLIEGFAQGAEKWEVVKATMGIIAAVPKRIMVDLYTRISS